VRNTLALERAALVASTVQPDVLASYLRWHAVSSYAPYLSKVFVAENFAFFETTLSGTEEMKPRWKRAMAFTESALGEVLGQLYCAKHFDEECKARAYAVVESVRGALEERLNEVDWMKSDATRQEALKKMSRFRIKIGYPNKWIDYSTLVMEDDDYFLSMVFKSRAFDQDREAKEMNAETDREKWVSYYGVDHVAGTEFVYSFVTLFDAAF
jgi:putative endopeptidase